MTQPKAHLIGICGAGMSAVAWLLQQDGYDVSGSDAGFYPPVSDYIARLGIPCQEGYRTTNIPENVDLIVIGKNAKLVPETNDEVRFALEKKSDRVKSFPEVLASLSEKKSRVVVAGSYGKSTLTSIITWCLVHVGQDPGYFIGAIPKNLENSSHLGAGKHFIFEGDEYPAANWDDRAKFLHYDPETVILTSACHDHVNIYPTLESYHAPFLALLDGLQKKSGQLIACIDEKNSADLFAGFSGNKVSYGLEDGADWSAKKIQPGSITTFELMQGDKSLGTVQTTLLGRHNVQNIVGAAAWLIGKKILTFSEFSSAISAFTGLDRRLDLKSEKTRLPIYEGFGSSYEKARAAITAVAEHYAGRDLVVLFEPHTFSWRNRARLDQYRDVFNGAQRVYLYQPPTQGADTHDQLTLSEILVETAAHHPDVRTFDSSNWREMIANADPARQVFLILSSGAFDGLLQKIVLQAEHDIPAALL
ncbi:UDP-N-acetylmuramate--L-alanine ligase [Parvularcula sp. IMCC14364]|uniref:UDP-N-acetylmuramate--L-alanine ligase n=1 Tax=Parvularcula sp. IMCC14364 TaxID=3067902 RepID=UPI002741D05A|nr:Mur ligase family protein [Parvularcula sp. IMCC14364]